MTTTIISHAELMTNHLQAEIVSAQRDFTALQTPDGRAVLFGVGSDGVLNAVVEQHGTSATGWTVTDVSSAALPPGATVSVFCAGQNATDHSFCLVMGVTGTTGQTLFVCLDKPGGDLTWIDAPSWTEVPCDALDVDPARIQITGVHVCEPDGDSRYIVADVLRHAGGPAKDVRRFVVDPEATGPKWIGHDLPIDVQADGYSTVPGRAHRSEVDGLYTAGAVGGSGQLVFVPLRNAFGTAPPPVTRLSLPDGVVPSAVAAMRNPDLSTDLFVVGGSTLYYFASTDQHHGVAPAVLLTGDVLTGTTELTAMRHEGTVTVWGRNGDDDVYSTSADADDLGTGTAWSVPLPVLTGMEHMSAYTNVADGGNTIVAIADDILQRVTRTGPNGVWAAERILLTAKKGSLTITSYTTTLQLTRDDGGPLRDIPITVTAGRRAGVYVDGLYYVMGPTPVEFRTNGAGSVTIIEATRSLVCTTFTATAPSGPATPVRPMDGPHQKLSALDTPGKLATAPIKAADGTTVRTLVPAGADPKALKTVAEGMGQLATCYKSVTGDNGDTSPRAVAATQGPSKLVLVAGDATVLGPLDSLDKIPTGIGDLIEWIIPRADAVLHLVKDEGQKLWYLVVRIGEALYSALIDTAEAVVAVAVELYKLVRTAVEDLIAFVEFLFDWGDIQRTKNVLHNLVLGNLYQQADEIDTVREQIDAQFQHVRTLVSTLTGVPDWSGLGPLAGQSPAASGAPPMDRQTPASQHLGHHLQNNAAQLTLTGDPPEVNLVENLVQDLVTAVQTEASVLTGAFDEIRQLAEDAATQSLGDVLKRLFGIIGETVLDSAQVVVNAMLELLADVARALIGLLDTPIDIPVLSDILAGIGVQKFSLLDAVTWAAACAYTVVYKLDHGSGPFPAGTTTTFLSTATPAEIRAALHGPHRAVAAEAALVTLPPDTARKVFVLGHKVSGYANWVGAVLNPAEVLLPYGSPVSYLATACNGLSGGSCVVTNYLVPKQPLQDVRAVALSYATTAVRMLGMLLFSPTVQKKVATPTEGDPRVIGSAFDAFISLPAAVCTGWHFYELSTAPDGNDRTEAILDEASYLMSYLSRFAYVVALQDKEGVTKTAAVIALSLTGVVAGELQVAEAGVPQG